MTAAATPLIGSPRAAAPPRPRHLADSRALVIGANPGGRSINCLQLRDLGMTEVRQCARLADARRALERERFDVVLFNDDFEDSGGVGWDLFDELRREQLLPHSTVLIVLASEATYTKVREAAEAALDGFLLKPYTAAALAERLQEAHRRKRELAELLKALGSGDLERAASLCADRFRRKLPYAAFAARVGAEVLLQLQRPLEAIALCEEVLKTGLVPWARLATARAHLLRGEAAKARRTCEELLAAQPQFADAYDVLGQLHVDQGDLEPAHAAFRQAAQLTPGCILRLQISGALAFYTGRCDEAQVQLERAVVLGSQSRLFDGLTLAMLALLHFDRRDSKALAATTVQIRKLAERFGESARLQRFERLARALGLLLAHQADASQALGQELASAALDDDFDLEAAVVTLALWSRLAGRDLSAAALESAARAIGLRHCISRSATEVLLAATGGNGKLDAMVRACQAEVAHFAETAMSHALAGRHRQAVQMLLEQGRQWRNAKLLEMSALAARRHQASIDDAAALAAEAAALLAAAATPTTHVAGLRRTGRSPGGLLLRR
jgi:CheY-like chemotaxis protein